MYAHNRDRDEFRRQSQQLRDLASTLSTKHLQFLKADFYFQAERYISGLQQDVYSHCLTWQGATNLLTNEIRHLSEQDFQLTVDHARLYMVLQKEKNEQSVNLVLKQLGFVAGGTQFAGGLGVWVASLGIACAGYGAPMMLHGANNVYENGYYLLYRSDKAGYVREGYRYAASVLGYGENQADFVYGSVDLGLTAYGATRLISLPREKSWSLFRHIESDYIRGWQEAPRVSLLIDGMSSGATGWSMYQLSGEK